MKVKLLVLLLILPASLNAEAQPHLALSCPEVPGLASLLKPGHVVLLGEMHGTNESPQFLSDALCVALQNGHSVTVGLELPFSETERADVFLESSGDAEAEQRLLKGNFGAFLHLSPELSKEFLPGRLPLADPFLAELASSFLKLVQLLLCVVFLVHGFLRARTRVVEATPPSATG